MRLKWIVQLRESWESSCQHSHRTSGRLTDVKGDWFVVEAGMELELVYSCRKITGLDNAFVFPVEEPEGYLPICTGKIIPENLAFLPDRDLLP